MNAAARTLSAAGVTILFCFLAAVCEGFDVQTAGVAAGGISREIQPTPAQLGLFFSASNFGLLIGAVFGGRLADRYGRKTILVTSIGAFGLFSLITSFAWNMELLTSMRVLTGIGLGGAMPNLIALASEASGARSRNTLIATTYIGFPLGAVMATLVIALAAQEHWRWVFVLGGVAPLVMAPVMAGLMPAPNAAAAAMRSGANASSRDGFVLELFGRGRLRHTMVLWAGFFLVALTLHLMLNWLPLLLQARGLSKSQAALAQIGFNVGGAAAALLIGAMLDTHWRRPSIAACVIALPVILFLLAIAPARSELLLVLALFLGGGILASHLILYGAAQSIYPVVARGVGIGAAVGAGRLGSIVGPAFVAVLIGAGHTAPQVLTSVLPIVILCGVCVVTLGFSQAGIPELKLP